MFTFAALETGLTVGEVAGLISGVVSTLQNLLPMIFALVLLGVIQKGQHNPATWSGISNQIQATLWPFVLRGDGSSAKHVWWRVQFISGLGLFTTITLVLAGFLTPKPLTDNESFSRRAHNSKFSYAPDLGYFGQGTAPQSDNTVHRLCGWAKFVDCPGSTYDDPVIRKKYPGHVVINSTIPTSTSHAFTNMTQGNTIASPMDIKYRNYYHVNDKYVDDNATYILGNLQPLETILLDNQYRLVEGLIIDTMNGGIGFRNHSVPLELELGAQWDEDLLWVFPDTACTPVNLSLHFSISSNYFYSTDNGYMTDDGGFAELDARIPSPRFDGPEDSWGDAFGESPDLQQRSYALAWWNNQFTARALNISSSSVGDRYTDQFFNYAELATPSSITISEVNGYYLDNIYYELDSDDALNFTSYGRRCSGFNDTDTSSSTKPYVRCGYLYGVPYPSEQGQSYQYNLGSNWTQEFYTCASAMKASIQTVTFMSNTTGDTADLSALSVVAVQPKNYTGNSLPLWAIEHVDGYQIEEISLFWGLANESLINGSAFETRHTAELYLPAANHQVTYGYLSTSFAAGVAFAAAWNSIYNYAASARGVSEDLIPSYSGEANYGLTLKYRDLSKTPEGAAKILNLIWTDLVAFATVGTNTGFELSADTLTASPSKEKRGTTASIVFGQKSVNRRILVVGYKDIRYAIPAFVVAFLLLASLLAALVMILCRLLSFRILKHYVNQTSMGRTATQIMDPTIVAVTASTKKWSEATRHMILDVPGPKEVSSNDMKVASPGPSLFSGHNRSSPALESIEEGAMEMNTQSQHRRGSQEYRPVPQVLEDHEGH